MFLDRAHAKAVRRRVQRLLMMHEDSILQRIGNTPLVRIRKMNPYEDIAIYAKLEGENPSGSLKDRIALYLIADAIERGELTPERTIVESSSGNTGIAVAMVGAVLGYKILITMPDNVSFERRRLIQAYGAQLKLTPGDLGTDGAIEEARRLAQHKGYVWIAQHYNEVNSFAHYKTTGAEIIDQLEGKRLDVFVATSGTTGSLMGISARLKEHFSNVRVISVWPKSKIMGLRRPEGQSRPGIYDESRVDEIIELENDESVTMALELGGREGLLVGPSGGAAMLGALRAGETLKRAQREGTIVVLIPDRGERYLSLGEFGPAD
jgi:cysteinyl-tRNA synthetase